MSSPDIKSKIELAAQLIDQSSHVVVITGAGISTPSGIPDFRSQKTGLWTQNDPMQVASMTVFRNNPQAFFDWFQPLTRDIVKAQPNPAHLALASLEKAGRIKALVTQNIDLLHQRAGSVNVIEVHGSMEHFNCQQCEFIAGYQSKIIQDYIHNAQIPRCPKDKSNLKPAITLFEELLPALAWDRAYNHCAKADLVIAVGTSLEVYPANLLPELALSHNARLIINTLSATPLDTHADVLLNEDVVTVWREIEKLLSS